MWRQGKGGSEIPAQFYSHIERNLIEGVFLIHKDTVEYANGAFLKLLGYESLDLVLVLDVKALFSEEGIFDKIKSLLAKSSILKDHVVEFVKSDLSTFIASVNLEHISEGGSVYYFGTLIDITSRVTTENELRQKNQDLKKLNSQLDRFLYSASHDIRQPLTSMMGLIRLMRMDRQQLNSNLYLDKLDLSVTKLDEFLTQVMEFSKNSHERIQSEKVELTGIVNGIIKEHQKHPYFSLIRFTIEENSNLVFYSDPYRLRIILEQVIRNSIHYCDPTKTQSFVKIIVTHYMHSVIIEVIDNGIGIARSHIGKVWDMFYRASERSKGSGLGLYIVKETLLKIEGRVTLDSEVSFGTIVHIEIPNGPKGKLINKKSSLLSLNQSE